LCEFFSLLYCDCLLSIHIRFISNYSIQKGRLTIVSVTGFNFILPIFERLKGMKICDVVYQGNSGSIPVVYRSNTLELLFSRCIPYLEFYSCWRF
jgi:hypothetical protein